MTIPQFAELAGARKNTVIDWQNNTSSPPALKLAALANIGLDVLFVITGKRAEANVSAPIHLPPQELTLLKRFRKLGDVQRKQALQMIDVLAQGGSMGGTTTSHSVSAHGPNSFAVGNVSGSSNVRIKRS